MLRSLFYVSILIGFLFFASNIVFAQTCPMPSAPSVSATAGPAHKQITVSASTPANGYTTIYVSGNGINFNALVNLYPSSPSYLQTGLDTNKTFYFYGISNDNCGSSNPSGIAQATTFDISPPSLSLNNSVHKQIAVTVSVPTGADYTDILISTTPFGNNCSGVTPQVHIYPNSSTTYILNGLDTNKLYYVCAAAFSGTRIRAVQSSITTRDIDPPLLSLDNSVHKQIGVTVSVPTGADYTDILISTTPFGNNCSGITPQIHIYPNSPMPYILSGLDTNKLYYVCAAAFSGTRIRAVQSSITTRDIDAPSLSANILSPNQMEMSTNVPTGADYTDLLLSITPFNDTCSGITPLTHIYPSSQLPFLWGATPNYVYYVCAVAISGTRRKATTTIVPYFADVNAGDSCPVQSVGKPVNVTNGNMWLQQSDYSLAGGVGESINISRTYNSITQSSGLFGSRWTTELDESIVVKDSYVVALMLPNGRGVYFSRSSVTTPFSPIIAGTYEQLIQNTDNTYTVAFRDGRIHRFSTTGKILYKQDRNGNQILFNYNPNGTLANVTDAFGRSIYFVITNNLITQITDAIGIVATYDYYVGTSNLKSVTYPDGSKYQFEYAVFGGKTVLTTVKDALNNILETHQYDSSARATTSEVHGGVEKYTLDYSQLYAAIPYTTVTDALGRVTKYY
jgi:Domain of unknown function (DUF6531)